MARILLVTYDNQSYMNWFSTGHAYIASALLRAGHEIDIYSQDLHHYPDEHLTNYLNKNKFDFVSVSIIGGYYQYKKLLSISNAINKSINRNDFKYILGGHMASPEPEYFLKKTQADAIVIGEGEETVVELVQTIMNKSSLKNVKGIAYRVGEFNYINERRPLIKDIDSILMPAYHLFDINSYRLLRMPHCSNTDFVMPMLSGRGCTFKCNFCYRMDKGFRPRSSESIIKEIKFLQRTYGITYIAFSDELLMSSERRTTELCNAFIDADLNIKFDCNGRLNHATPEVLKVMKEAGCVFINFGIESVDDTVLKNMHKNLTVKQITDGVENTLNAGISPGLNIIFGNIGDTAYTLQKGVEFLLKYDDGSQLRTIRPVSPYPGCELYYHAIKKELLKGVEDFYEIKHTNSDLLSVNFTELSDEVFHNELFKANSILIKNYFKHKCNGTINEAKKLYLEENKDFRGFRST